MEYGGAAGKALRQRINDILDLKILTGYKDKIAADRAHVTRTNKCGPGAKLCADRITELVTPVDDRADRIAISRQGDGQGPADAAEADYRYRAHGR